MATIVTRAGKGTPLTNTELDANFTNLNSEVGGKAAAAHSHTIADTPGLQAALDGKQGVLTGGFSFRNKLINGCFRVWQRGISTTTDGYKSADRWQFNFTAVGVTGFSSSRVGYSSTGPDTDTTEGLSITGTSTGIRPYIRQAIEDVKSLAGKQVTFSGWVKGTTSLRVRLVQNFGSGGSPYVETFSSEMAVGSGWTRITTTITLPSVAGKSLGANHHLAFDVQFPASGSYSVELAELQLEVGTVATPFEIRPYAVELALCQRYYEEVYALWGTAGAVSMWHHSAHYRVAKRVSPTLVIYADSIVGTKVGATNAVRNVTASSNIALLAIVSLPMTFVLDYSSPASASNMQATVVADAEL